MKIGCVGQGFVGKNIANDFVARGYDVVRYGLEEEYVGNKDRIADCDVVFIAVPTPTTPSGFDASIVEEALGLVGRAKIAVIKSTLLPGTTERLQDAFPQIVIIFSPELLSERTAAYEVANPMMNVIGLSYDTAGHRKAGTTVLSLLPPSPHNFIVTARAAELYKYAHNLQGYFRVILSNLLFEVAEKQDIDWGEVKSMMNSDVYMSPYYNNPVHKGGRGAGGNCFIKDMAAFRDHYSELVPEDTRGLLVLQALEKKNLELLHATGKSKHIIEGVYGTKKE
jgi:UDPglucose 6-dehydrogenase